MKFSCERNSLAKAVNGVSTVAPSVSSVPVLLGILFKAEGTKLHLTGYDLEIGITVSLDADIQEEGSVVLNAKLVGDILRFAVGETISFSCDDTLVTNVKCASTEYTITGMQAADYPSLPEVASAGGESGGESLVPIVAMGRQVLRQMIGATIYAAAQNDQKPANTGELFSFGKGELTIAALDGYRLAVCRKKAAGENEISVVIPAKAMNLFVRLIGDSEETVTVSANRRYVLFSFCGYTVISRLIEDAFLDYKKTINPNHITRVVVDVREFCDSIERASLIITERMKNPLRIKIDSMITLHCQTELGRVVDKIACQFEGEPMEVGLNNRYLLDAIRSSGCEKVALELNGPLSPIKVLPTEGDDFVYLVMPVRFKND